MVSWFPLSQVSLWILIILGFSQRCLELESLGKSILNGDLAPSPFPMHSPPTCGFFLIWLLPAPDGSINGTQDDSMPVLIWGKHNGSFILANSSSSAHFEHSSKSWFCHQSHPLAVFHSFCCFGGNFNPFLATLTTFNLYK